MTLRRILPLMLLAMSACSVELVTPNDAVITCSSSQDCPSGSFCSDNLGRCVAVGGDDVAPQVTLFTTEGVLFGLGTSIEASFTASEPLRDLPAVELVCGDQSFGMDLVTEDAQDYVFARTVLAGDPQGRCAIAITLVDEAGNELQTTFADAVEVELLPPTLIAMLLRLVPNSENPRFFQGVGSATVGTRVELSLTFGEALREAPVVTASDDAATVDFGPPQNNLNPAFSFSHDVSNLDLDGDYVITVTAYDVAGNEAQIVLGPEAVFAIDTTPPAAVSNLRFVRVPWGDDDNEPRFVLRMDGGAVGEPLASIFVYDPARTYLLGTADLDSNGALANTWLNTADRTSVLVIAVDDAGNTSPPALVGRGSYVMSLRGRVAGNPLGNQSRLEAVTTAEPTLFPEFAGEPATALIARLADADEGGTAESYTITGSRAWVTRRQNVPAGTTSTVFATQATTGKSTLIGGIANDEVGDGQWEWNGVDWRELDIQGNRPAARIGGMGAYDARRDRIVVFGGAAGLTTSYPDLWEWDGQDWIDVTPVDENLPSLAFGAAAYDPERELVLFFGGMRLTATSCTSDEIALPGFGACITNGLWGFDGIAWRDLCAEGLCGATVPAPRHGAGLAYDAASGHMVLFGGRSIPSLGTCPDGNAPLGGGTYCALADTWLWDGAGFVGPLEAPEGAPAQPSGRYGHGMVYDAANGTVSFFGGCTAGDFFSCQGAFSDTWDWKGDHWEDRFAGIDSPMLPPRRGFAGVSYDSARQQLLVTGGTRVVPKTTSCDDAATSEDESVCDGGAAPSERDGGASCSCAQAGTWALAGTTWTRVASPSDLPEPTAYAALAFDEARDVSVLFGGDDRGGGCDGSTTNGTCGSLWEWDGTRWNKRYAPNIEDPDTCDPALPCRRSQHAMAYIRDGAEKRVVVFGGSSNSGACDTVSSSGDFCERTWLWNGAAGTWSEVVTATKPGGRVFTAMAGAGSEAYVFGGLSYGACASADDGTTQEIFGTDRCISKELWVLTLSGSSATWERITQASAETSWPAARFNHVMTYDSARDVLVLFGGCTAAADNRSCSNDPSSMLNDLWEFDLAARTWTEVQSRDAARTSGPAPRGELAMIYDQRRARSIIFGGGQGDGGNTDNQTWEWDGTAGTWSRVTTLGVGPAPHRRHAAAYDRVRSRMLVVGGGASGEVWEWTVGPLQRPAAHLTFAYDASGVPVDAITSLTFQLDAVGTGYEVDRNVAGAEDDPADSDRIGAAATGIAIDAWDWLTAAWTQLLVASNDDPLEPVDTPCITTAADRWTCTLAADVAERYVLPGTGRIYVRLRPPRGMGNGPTAPTVSVDYAELKVDYELP